MEVFEVKEVGVQWEPPDQDLEWRGHREVGVQCDRPGITETGVQVDLDRTVDKDLSCVRAEQPEGGALLQNCTRPRTRGRPRLNHDRTRARDKDLDHIGDKDQMRAGDQDLTQISDKDQDQTSAKTRTRTREIRPSRKYQDFEIPESPDRKRSRREGREDTDPNWNPVDPQRASLDTISHVASVCVKAEPGLKGVVCEVCGKVLKSKSSLARHSLVHSGSKPHGCPHCPLHFNRKDNLLCHLRHMHPPPGHAPHRPRPPPSTWLCHTCGKTFTCRSRLRTHEEIHTGVKPCQCPLCPKAYMRVQDLDHHLSTVHPNGEAQPPPPPPLLCHLCGRECRSKSLLSLHLQTHTGERPHLCHLCGRKFSRKQQLRAHTATIHREEELQPTHKLEPENGEETNGLECEVCGRRMKTAALLEAHLSVHSGDKPHTCTICGKGFQRPATLKQHQVRFHLSSAPRSSGSAPSRPCSYPCYTCGRSFRFRSLLLVHSAVHSDLRPFSCDLCPRSFRRRSHLTRHSAAVHPDGRPRRSHICPICGLDQNYSSKLKRHLLVHSGERPYSCDRCGQSFGRLGNLQQHQRRIHGDRIQRRRSRYDDDDEDTPPVCIFEDDTNEETWTYKQEDALSDEGLAGSEVVEAGSEVVEAGSEVVEAGSEVVEAGSEVVEAGSEVVEGESEVVEARSEVGETEIEVVAGGGEVFGAKGVFIEAVVLGDEAEVTQIEVSSSEFS